MTKWSFSGIATQSDCEEGEARRSNLKIGIASSLRGSQWGLLRNTIFRHPFTSFRAGSDPDLERSEREGEGSYQRRDSSAGACTDPERSEGECGLRMTAQTEFRNSPQ